jgi:hypothetical protein
VASQPVREKVMSPTIAAFFAEMEEEAILEKEGA